LNQFQVSNREQKVNNP